MSGYRRFVAYVYEYRKGKKESNCGFIKVEVKENQCGMEVHLRCPGLTPKAECRIYGFIRNAGLMDSYLLGICRTGEGSAECVLETDAMNMGGSGISLGRMGGMILKTENGAFFGTEWDDQPIRPENFREISPKVEEPIKESVPQPPSFVEEKEMIPETGVLEEEKTEEKEVPEQEEETERYESDVQTDIADEKAADEKEAEVPEEAKTEIEATSQAVCGQEMPEQFPVPEGQKQKQEWMSVPEGQDQRQERTSVPEGQDQRQERMSVPERQDQRQEWTSVPEGQDQRREWMPVPEEQEQKKRRTSVPGEQNREQQWSSMPEEQRARQGEISVSQRQRTSASEENWSFGDSCEAFSDGEIVSCRKIEIRDLSKLHCRECALRNNRFLLYGYYNFGHLLLGKKCTGGYILGVPGGYDQQERFMANMFGFPYFKESKLIELPKGRGGYWYRLINTPNFH